MEKKWRSVCAREADSLENTGYNLQHMLPSDLEFASAFSERKAR